MATSARPRKTDYVGLDDVVAALRNPKAHAPDRVVTAIKKFGFIDPIIDDGRTGRLVAGHGRVEALIQMRDAGDDPPDGIVVRRDGAWQVPVTKGWASRSDEDAHAAGVALNRLTEVGGWDDRELAEMLDEFADSDPDLLAATGYNQDDLDDMVARFGAPPSLDDLGDQYGDPADKDLWPRISLAIPKDLRARYMNLMEATDGEEHEKFAAIIGWAETGKPA